MMRCHHRPRQRLVLVGNRNHAGLAKTARQVPVGIIRRRGQGLRGYRASGRGRPSAAENFGSAARVEAQFSLRVPPVLTLAELTCQEGPRAIPGTKPCLQPVNRLAAIMSQADSHGTVYTASVASSLQCSVERPREVGPRSSSHNAPGLPPCSSCRCLRGSHRRRPEPASLLSPQQAAGRPGHGRPAPEHSPTEVSASGRC